MSTPLAIRRALPRSGTPFLLGLLLALGLVVSPTATPRAQAAVSLGTVSSAARVAAAQVGVPYRYGGASPSTGFDCSGLTMYSYARAGKQLPRSAQEQYAASTRISAGSARPGDLVFFHSGSSVYHVAVYAGGGYVWHAPRPGKRVARVQLWTSAVTYGRVR